MDYRTPSQRIQSQGPDDFAHWVGQHFDIWQPCQACPRWVTSTDRGLCERCRREQDRLERALAVAVIVCLLVAAVVLGWGA